MVFQAARLKLKRAEIHLQTLQRELDDYLNRGPIRITTKTSEAEPEFFEWSIDATEPVPIELSTVIGDFVHNLRTSLDLLACELVRLNRASDKDVHFPFAKDASELEKEIKRRHLKRADPAAVDLIRALKPYKHGNLALRGIHDLDIKDKHQTLLPVAGQIHGPGIVLSYERLEDIGTQQLAHGKTRLEHAGAMPIGRIIPASFKLVFPRGLPFAELELLPNLYRLLHYFSRVIGAFEAHTLGQKPDVNAIKF